MMDYVGSLVMDCKERERENGIQNANNRKSAVIIMTMIHDNCICVISARIKKKIKREKKG